MQALAPHFATFIALVVRAVRLSMVTGTPLRLPAVLLLGEPGIGKTYVMKQVNVAVDFCGRLYQGQPAKVTKETDLGLTIIVGPQRES